MDDFSEDWLAEEHERDDNSMEPSYEEDSVILIDAQPSSLEPCTIEDKDFNGCTWLETAIKVAQALLRTKLIAGTSITADKVAIVFYNTRETKNDSSQIDNVYMLQSLDEPTIERIRDLRDFSLQYFKEKIGQGSSSEFDRSRSLAAALLQASIMLPQLETGRKRPKGPRRVLICTRDDRPEIGLQANSVFETQVKNIIAKGGTLQLMPLADSEKTFDLNVFWNPLLDRIASEYDLISSTTTLDRSSTQIPGSEKYSTTQQLESQSSCRTQGEEAFLEDLELERVVKLESLQSVVRMKAYSKRSTTRMKWSLGTDDGVVIGAKLYSLITRAKTGAKSLLHAKDLTEIKASTALIDTLTGKPYKISGLPLMQSGNSSGDGGEEGTATRAAATNGPDGEGEALRRRYPPDSIKNARFLRAMATVEELKEIKYPLSKGLTLIAAKPRSWLQPYHQLHESAFAYPDESSIKGSTLAFIAFHTALLESDSLAICALVRTPSAEPRLVAAVPQQETETAYPGIHLIHLPYLDDFRKPEEDPSFAGALPLGGGGGGISNTSHAPTEDQIAAADNLISLLELGQGFDPSYIPNPSLQRHYQILEGYALKEPIPEVDDTNDPDALIDETVPDKEAFEDDDVMEAIKAFKEAVNLSDDKAVKGSGSGKGSKRKAAGGFSEEEKAELEAEVENLGIVELALEQGLGDLTITQLKQYLTLYGLPKTGKKEDLIARIEMHVHKHHGA